jgi:hypothetical protein
MSGLDGGGGHGGSDHGFSHDSHGGHGGHHGNDGGHGGHATREALMIAFSHGGQNGHMNVVGQHVSSAHPHSMQVVHLGLGRQDTKIGKAKQTGDAGEIRTFVVHVSNHGQGAILTQIEKFARKCDMLRIDQVRPNFDSIDNIKYLIADWTAFTEPYQQLNMPEGYFPGVTGYTRILRQYWQVGKRPSLWAPHTPPVFDKSAATFIEVTVVEWRYQEIGDYETKIILNVSSLQVWDEVAQAWGYKRVPFERHQHAAKKICEQVFEYLVATPPTKAASLLRAEATKKFPPDPTHLPDGIAPGTPEDEADLSHSHPDPSEHRRQPPPPTTDGGDDGNDGGSNFMASDVGEVVDSGADLDAVLGVADDASAPPPAAPTAAKPAVKTAPLVVELDD